MNFVNLKCENIHYSTINIFIRNEELGDNKYAPINIWFNNSLVVTKELKINCCLRYKIFSEGYLKITAQLSNLTITKTEYCLNIINDSTYNVMIEFGRDNYHGSIYGIKKTSAHKQCGF
jgi:hypothetical protein